MKVFAYDPITGKRGEFIEEQHRASFGGCSVGYAIKTGQLKDMGWVTGDFGGDSEVTIHTDAGITGRDGKSVSFITDRWICFCTGKWKTGTKEAWVWMVLPSKQDLEEATIASND